MLPTLFILQLIKLFKVKFQSLYTILIHFLTENLTRKYFINTLHLPLFINKKSDCRVLCLYCMLYMQNCSYNTLSKKTTDKNESFIYLELGLQKLKVFADAWEIYALCNYKVLHVQLQTF